MAAPRPGFDPSLNPGSPEAVESTHTAEVAAENAKPPKADGAKEGESKSESQKKEEKKEEKALIQKNAPAAGAPEVAPEPTAK
jgi:hypothetical protein